MSAVPAEQVWGSTNTNFGSLVKACQMQDTYFHISATAGSGKTWTFTVQKGDSNTTITAAITGTSALNANDTAHDVDVNSEIIWEDFESVDDHELLNEAAAWRTSKGKSKTGGLNAKGVASYRRENPGSKLQMAVTTKPSKLKKGSKAAKRRKSFCARMGGVKGPMKKPNGKPTRKALALRKWNC
jgi:hypothetical protein